MGTVLSVSDNFYIEASSSLLPHQPGPVEAGSSLPHTSLRAEGGAEEGGALWWGGIRLGHIVRSDLNWSNCQMSLGDDVR